MADDDPIELDYRHLLPDGGATIWKPVTAPMIGGRLQIAVLLDSNLDTVTITEGPDRVEFRRRKPEAEEVLEADRAVMIMLDEAARQVAERVIGARDLAAERHDPEGINSNGWGVWLLNALADLGWQIVPIPTWTLRDTPAHYPDHEQRLAAFQAMGHEQLAHLAAETAAGLRHLRALVLGGRQADGEAPVIVGVTRERSWVEDGNDVEAAIYYLITGIDADDQAALMATFVDRYGWDADYVARIALDWSAMAELRDAGQG